MKYKIKLEGVLNPYEVIGFSLLTLTLVMKVEPNATFLLIVCMLFVKGIVSSIVVIEGVEK